MKIRVRLHQCKVFTGGLTFLKEETSAKSYLTFKKLTNQTKQESKYEVKSRLQVKSMFYPKLVAVNLVGNSVCSEQILLSHTASSCTSNIES